MGRAILVDFAATTELGSAPMGLFGRDDDGGKTLVFMGGSETVLGFAATAKRRKRVLGIALVAGLVVAGVAGFGVTRYLKATATRRIVDSYGSLSRCLLGEPLAQGERASTRFRALQLDSLTLGENKRAAGAVWPDRCAVHAHALAEGLLGADALKEKAPNLAAEAKTLAETLEKKDAYWQAPSAALDAMFGSAGSAGLVLVSKPEVEAPPAPKAVLSLDSLPRDSRSWGAAFTRGAASLSSLHFERHASNTVRIVVTDAKAGTATLCTVTDARAACAPLAKAVSEAEPNGVRLLGTASAEAGALVFAARGKGGAFRAGGERVSQREALGGYVDKNGFLAVLEAPRDTRGVRLPLDADMTGFIATLEAEISLLTVDGARSANHRLNLRGSEIVGAQLLWGHVVVVGSNRDGLSLASATADARGPITFQPIGELAGAKPSAGAASADAEGLITGCSATGAVAVRVATANSRSPSGASGAKDFIALRNKNAWSAPFALPRTGGLLSCHGSEASVTRVDSGASTLDAVVSHSRCDAAGCRESRVALTELLAGEVGLAPAGPLFAVGLADKLLVVWQAAQRGGLRMRLGAPESIAKAEDVVLFDDLLEKAAVSARSTLLEVRLVAAETFTLVLLGTSEGVRALRISADGKVTPVTT